MRNTIWIGNQWRKEWTAILRVVGECSSWWFWNDRCYLARCASSHGEIREKSESHWDRPRFLEVRIILRHGERGAPTSMLQIIISMLYTYITRTVLPKPICLRAFFGCLLGVCHIIRHPNHLGWFENNLNGLATFWSLLIMNVFEWFR